MKKTILIPLFMALISFNVMAVQYYDDGQEHDISTPVGDSIAIYNGDVHMGPPTTVNLLSGGNVGFADVYDSSIFNVFTGGEVGVLRSHVEGEFFVFDGYVDMIETNHHSQGTVSGGEVFQIDARGDSYASVTGGIVEQLAASENGTGIISGGMINRVFAIENGTIDMSDGSVWEMNLHETSSGNLTGGIVYSLTTNQNSQLVLTDVIMDEPSYVQAYDSSRVTMTGGEGFIDAMGDSVVQISNATVDIAVQENAQVAISDSQINYLPPELHMNSSLHLNNTFIFYNNDIQLFDNSHLTASTGTGLWTVDLHNNSTFTLSGGFLERILAADESLVEISDGDVMEIDALGNSTIEITGGNIINNIFADQSGLIVIHGLDFNYGYGYITDTSGFLTGTLLSGDFIDVSFDRFDDAQILLVPEPATLLLVGIGAVMIKKRK